MKLNWSLEGKVILLLTVLVSLTLLIVKFYFIPQVDGFLELTMEHDMKRNMQSFEKVIHTVVTAADQDEQVVRRALTSISRNQEIPVVLVRSQAIQRQYGEGNAEIPQNTEWQQVFSSGNPDFHKKDGDYVYVYPLKAKPVCQNCHRAENRIDPIPLGSVLGLAVASTPQQTLWDNKLFFFVKDLFFYNLLWIALLLFLVYLFIRAWFILPLKRLHKTSEELDEVEEESFEFETDGRQLDEFSSLERRIRSWNQNGKNTGSREGP